MSRRMTLMSMPATAVSVLAAWLLAGIAPITANDCVKVSVNTYSPPLHCIPLFRHQPKLPSVQHHYATSPCRSVGQRNGSGQLRATIEPEPNTEDRLVAAEQGLCGHVYEH